MLCSCETPTLPGKLGASWFPRGPLISVSNHWHLTVAEDDKPCLRAVGDNAQDTQAGASQIELSG